MKVCSKCKQTMPLDRFPRNKDGKDGRNSVCACCKKVKHKEYMARPDVLVKTRTYQSTYRKNNPSKARAWHLRTEYGITVQDYDLMLELQKGRCAICGEECSLLHVDHDHVTGKVRGLLCQVGS